MLTASSSNVRFPSTQRQRGRRRETKRTNFVWARQKERLRRATHCHSSAKHRPTRASCRRRHPRQSPASKLQSSPRTSTMMRQWIMAENFRCPFRTRTVTSSIRMCWKPFRTQVLSHRAISKIFSSQTTTTSRSRSTSKWPAPSAICDLSRKMKRNWIRIAICRNWIRIRPSIPIRLHIFCKKIWLLLAANQIWLSTATAMTASQRWTATNRWWTDTIAASAHRRKMAWHHPMNCTTFRASLIWASISHRWRHRKFCKASVLTALIRWLNWIWHMRSNRIMCRALRLRRLFVLITAWYKWINYYSCWCWMMCRFSFISFSMLCHVHFTLVC